LRTSSPTGSRGRLVAQLVMGSERCSRYSPCAFLGYGQPSASGRARGQFCPALPFAVRAEQRGLVSIGQKLRAIKRDFVHHKRDFHQGFAPLNLRGFDASAFAAFAAALSRAESKYCTRIRTINILVKLRPRARQGVGNVVGIFDRFGGRPSFGCGVDPRADRVIDPILPITRPRCSPWKTDMRSRRRVVIARQRRLSGRTRRPATELCSTPCLLPLLRQRRRNVEANLKNNVSYVLETSDGTSHFDHSCIV